MKCSSERASPGGSSALSRHWSRRWVFVKVALLLDVRGGGHQEDLGLDVLGAQLARAHLRRVLPEARRLEVGQVAHHEPLEVRQRAPLQARVLRADRRVLAHHEQPVEAAVERAQHRREVRVVAGSSAGTEAVVVVRRRGVAEPGLEQRDDVLVEVAPPAALDGAAGVDVVRQRLVAPRAPSASAGSRAAGRRAWGCRSSPGSRRGRAAP